MVAIYSFSSQKSLLTGPFQVTRLETIQGVVRLSGVIEPVDNDCCVVVHEIYVMGTDGWEALQLKGKTTQQMLERLKPELLTHLAARHS